MEDGKLVPGGKQTDIAAVLAKKLVSREELFITTKIPAGFGILTGLCVGGAEKALKQVKEDLKELNVSQVDLVLLHHPCLLDSQNDAMWKGLEEALAQNLTRAIGVSNYKKAALEKLVAGATVKPAVDQCDMGVGDYDAETIAYAQSEGITYEACTPHQFSLGPPSHSHASLPRHPLRLKPARCAVASTASRRLAKRLSWPDLPLSWPRLPHSCADEAMRGCPFSDASVGAIAKGHGVSVAQVCLRWVLQRGAVMAIGTGANASKVRPAPPCDARAARPSHAAYAARFSAAPGVRASRYTQCVAHRGRHLRVRTPSAPHSRAQVAGYAKEDLDLFGFALSDSEMTLLDNYKKPKA